MSDMERFYLPDGSLNVRLIGRLITGIENNPKFAEEFLAEIYRADTGTLILGITGPPGAGKSSLTDGIIARYRQQDKTVAVIAVDPSSPFTGGAILGDRIRMSAHATDPGVFIRSMGSRGSLGGLAPATVDIMNFLSYIGFDVVIIETMGVGQGEIDIMHLADTVLLVLVPGLGDDIQVLKAGIMEIADIFIVNKADKPGIEKLIAELNSILSLAQETPEWNPPVVEMVATENKGFEQLLEEVDRHRVYLQGSREGLKNKKIGTRFRRMIDDKIATRIYAMLNEDERIRRWIDQIVSGETNPYSALKELDKKLKVLWEE
jgi:LAO/AO transport system kinase